VADMEETEDGLRVLIRRSKTDQEGRAMASNLPASVNESKLKKSA
jgi:hypothetical protein